MADHASALKRLKESEKKHTRNKAVKSAIKTAVKKIKDSIKAGKLDESKVFLKEAVSLLDGAVTKGALHRNNASRKISRLTAALNAASPK